MPVWEPHGGAMWQRCAHLHQTAQPKLRVVEVPLCFIALVGIPGPLGLALGWLAGAVQVCFVVCEGRRVGGGIKESTGIT